MIHLPALVLPAEYVGLLKVPTASGGVGLPAVDMLKKSPALYMVMERAFYEFNEHNIGLEKIASTLGWSNFRDRMASVYVFKALHGTFPDKTDMELVQQAIELEARFNEKSITGTSRIFMLGIYLRFLNIYISMRDDGSPEVSIPASVDKIIALRNIKTDRPDWLILLCWHLESFLGASQLATYIESGLSWAQLYQKLSQSQQFHLVSNLLSYGASIQEEDPFLYERI
jgi:hypothetical protein